MGETANDGVRGTAGALVLVCVALLGSALAVLAVRSDVLTGRAPAVTMAPCAARRPRSPPITRP